MCVDIRCSNTAVVWSFFTVSLLALVADILCGTDIVARYGNTFSCTISCANKCVEVTMICYQFKKSTDIHCALGQS